MNFIKKCDQCHTELRQYSSIYQCCETDKYYCLHCKLNRCPKCNKYNWKEVKEKPCFICKKTIVNHQALRQQICGQNYCPRCLVQTFLPHYLSKQIPIIIELRCGHFKDKIEVEQLLSDYCINCGYKFRKQFDFQLQDGMKLCQYCFKYEAKKFYDFLFRCLNCNKIMRVCDGSEMQQVLLCPLCAQSQTTIHSQIQNSLSISKTKQNSLLSSFRPEAQQAKPYDQQELPQQISIVSRFSAFQIKQQQQDNNNNNSDKHMKITSKNSVEIRVENFKLTVNLFQGISVRCSLCYSFLPEDIALDNSTYNQSKICRMCFSQSIDKSQITFARTTQRNQERLKYTSLPKSKPIAVNQPSTILKYNNYIQNPPEKSELLTKLTVLPVRTVKKQPWQVQTIRNNACQICNIKNSMITRADKKRVCVQCHNKRL